jgi:hypothetical protein
MIQNRGPDLSTYAFRINAIRELLRERNIQLVKINRYANNASHELAKIGKVQGRTEFWLGDFPAEIAATILYDCNSVMP